MAKDDDGVNNSDGVEEGSNDMEERPEQAAQWACNGNKQGEKKKVG